MGVRRPFKSRSRRVYGENFELNITVELSECHYCIGNEITEGRQLSFTSTVYVQPSAGEGKSRLATQVAPFVLSLVLSSGYSEMNVLKESDDLRKFDGFIQNDVKSAHSILHITLTFNFIIRVTFSKSRKN